jgi:hypothetical protein
MIAGGGILGSVREDKEGRAHVDVVQVTLTAKKENNR